MIPTPMPTMHFELPEHAAYVKTLGYATGLSSGMSAPPVGARGPVKTNDPEQFEQLFSESHEAGFAFGKHAAGELMETLNSLPKDCWWMVCLFFAGERMQAEPETIPAEIPPTMKRQVERGVKAFRRAYQHYLV